jgi:hypothetical protein
LIFLGRSFGKSFLVVLRGPGSNLVIFGGRLIDFCLFPLSLSKAEILFRASPGKNPESPDFYSELFLRTFIPETPETPGKSAEIPDFPVAFA